MVRRYTSQNISDSKDEWSLIKKKKSTHNLTLSRHTNQFFLPDIYLLSNLIILIGHREILLNQPD